MGTRIMVSTNANIAAGAGTPKSILGYTAPSGIAAKVLRAGLSFDGTSNTDARANVDWLKRSSTAGTSTDISSEIAVLEGKTTTLGSAAQNYSAEPGTDGNSRVIRPELQPPNSNKDGFLVNVSLDPAERFHLRVWNASGRTVRAWMEIELG